MKQEENSKTHVTSEDTSKLSDEEYWKQYGHQFDNEDDSSGSDIGISTDWYGHNVSVDISIKFKHDMQVVYETKETDVNCADLEDWFTAFRKQVRWVDENKTEGESGLF
jgi:hypothetical protein